MHRGSLSIDRGINAIYRFIRFLLLYCNFLPTGSREEPKIFPKMISYKAVIGIMDKKFDNITDSDIILLDE